MFLTKKKRNSKKKFSKKYPITKKKYIGGQNKSNYKEDPLSFISGLLHGTSLEYAIDILKTKFIVANPGTNKRVLNNIETTFNKGVFVQALFKCSKNNVFNYNTTVFPVNFIFSNQLLYDREDWHLSNNWMGGMTWPPASKRSRIINGKQQQEYFSFKKEQIGQYIDMYYDSICSNIAPPLFKNEIVFQDNIPLTYLKAIYIYDSPNLSISSHKKITRSNGTQDIQRITTTNTQDPQEKCDILVKVLAELGYNNIPIYRVKNKLPDINLAFNNQVTLCSKPS